MGKTQAHARPKNLRATLRQVAYYFAQHRAMVAVVIVLVVISSLANVLGTYLLKPIINNYILPGNLQGLWQALIPMAAMYLVGALSAYGYSQLMVRVGQRIIQELRRDLFHKVQTLPLRFFDARTHGELMSRFTNDIDTISEALNNSFTVLIQSTVMLVSTCALLLILDWKLSIAVLLAFVGLFVFARYSSKKSHQFFQQQQQHLGSLNGFVEEMVEGQKVVQVFNHEEKNLEEFKVRNEQLRAAGTSAFTYSGLLIPVVVSLSYFTYALAACIGAFFAIAGWMDIGSLTSYLVYVRQTAMPINQFSQQINFLMAALSGAERIFAIMNESPEIDEGTTTLVRAKLLPDGSLQECSEYTGVWAWKRPTAQGFELIQLRGDVRFHDVTFSYEPGHVILDHISLYAKPGQKIAFVGSTGAGKTTITNLINRFYEVDSGAITYDGIDIRTIQKRALRRSLGMVLQDTHLFTGTIADNIAYGAGSLTREQVEAAAKLANADSFIQRLPQGYDTMLTGDGANLSQGQRQLLSIARAAAANPPVLILDEATSSVDTRTEKLIESGMDHLMEGRTVFVIAHRLSTVRNSKAILLLEHGEILERGSHDELIAQHGRYYQLYTGQFELS